MYATILIPLAILCIVWLLAVIIYRLLKIQEKKKWIKVTSLLTGSTLSLLFSFWIIISMGGSIGFHLFTGWSSEGEYEDQLNVEGPERTDLVAFWNDDNYFFKESNEYNNEKLVVADTNGNDLSYYLYSKKESNITENIEGEKKKVVIVNHGLGTSRFRNYPFFEQLQKTDELEDAIFVSYDSIGWNDGAKRGNPTLGKLEGNDLYKVIMDVKNRLVPSEIILYGFSMGGATIYSALNDYGKELVEDDIISKVIIDSSYYRLDRQIEFYGRVISGLMPFFIDVSPWLYSLDSGVDINFNAFEVVSKIDIPIMLIHARKDSVVDFAFSCEMNIARNKNGLGDKTFSWFEDEVGHAKFETNYRDVKFPNNIDSFLKNTPFPDDINVENCI